MEKRLIYLYTCIILSTLLSLSCLFVMISLNSHLDNNSESIDRAAGVCVAREPVASFDPLNFSFSPASAHKILHPSQIFRDDKPVFSNDVNCPLLFDPSENDPLTEHAQNVEVLSSGYRVLVPGSYYIYSNVHFRPDSSKPCKDYDFQTWESVIIRTRPNDRQNSGVILRSLHTCCDDCVRNKETSYAGGVFHLQANDRLHVEVSGVGLISFQKQSTFFGLMMLGTTV